MNENTALLVISLLVAALQALTLFILSRIDNRTGENEKDLKQHLQDHAQREFCKPCRDLLKQAISTP